MVLLPLQRAGLKPAPDGKSAQNARKLWLQAARKLWLKGHVGLPHLPAAVEVAAYRIALEALTNVIRHAQAAHCTIQFKFGQDGYGPALQVEIADDGVGLARDLRGGVGLRSMRERAEELRGKLSLESSTSGGTRVIASLPLGEGAFAL